MRKVRLTPQEKKILSYQKDRRNNYGEHDKSSRKAIRRRKVLERRRQRRVFNSYLKSEPDKADPKSDTFDTETPVLKWVKFADEPLATHINSTFDYGRPGLDKRRKDVNQLRAEALRRLKKSRRPKD